VTLRARWVTLRARWVTFTGWQAARSQSAASKPRALPRHRRWARAAGLSRVSGVLQGDGWGHTHEAILCLMMHQMHRFEVPPTLLLTVLTLHITLTHLLNLPTQSPEKTIATSFHHRIAPSSQLMRPSLRLSTGRTWAPTTGGPCPRKARAATTREAPTRRRCSAALPSRTRRTRSRRPPPPPTTSTTSPPCRTGSTLYGLMERSLSVIEAPSWDGGSGGTHSPFALALSLTLSATSELLDHTHMLVGGAKKGARWLRSASSHAGKRCDRSR
jgi:hypothetical protein